MTKELQIEVNQIYENYLKLSVQDDKDYENVKKIIADSDLMLNNYRKQYKETINERNHEIQQLQEQLKNIKAKNEIIKTTLYNIPEDIRKKYIKNTVTSF